MLRSLEWMERATSGHLVPPPQVDPGDEQAKVDLSLAVTDSREVRPGSTYIARIGENSDGHDFAISAIENGAVALIVERELSDVSVSQVVVDDSTVALGSLARAHLADLRKTGELSVVGITGSAGKTTTKDLLGRVLAEFGPSVWPKASFNNEVGCPMTILKADESTRYLILEMGASAKGELTYLTNIAPLDVGVVLMVGRAHLGGFGGVKGLARAKAELVEGIVPGGVAVLNRDDTAVVGMSRFVPGGICWFSATHAEESNVWADEIVFDKDGCASFTVSDGESRSRVHLGLVGKHQVSNALAAISTALVLGLDFDRVALSISGLGAGSPHRMDVHSLTLDLDDGPVRVRLIDDSYNANPDSMKAAFRTARGLADGGRLVMVLGEMLELGPLSDQIHEEVGTDALDASPNLLVLIGAAAAYVVDDSSEVSVIRVEDPAQALDVLRTQTRTGDTILVKGSNGSGSWKVADGLLQMNESPRKAEMA